MWLLRLAGVASSSPGGLLGHCGCSYGGQLKRVLLARRPPKRALLAYVGMRLTFLTIGPHFTALVGAATCDVKHADSLELLVLRDIGSHLRCPVHQRIGLRTKQEKVII